MYLCATFIHMPFCFGASVTIFRGWLVPFLSKYPTFFHSPPENVSEKTQRQDDACKSLCDDRLIEEKEILQLSFPSFSLPPLPTHSCGVLSSCWMGMLLLQKQFSCF